MRIVSLNFALMPKRRKAVGQLDMSLKIKKRRFRVLTFASSLTMNTRIFLRPNHYLQLSPERNSKSGNKQENGCVESKTNF